jgi:hypothetical protein
MNESLPDFRFRCENKSLEELKALRAHMDDDAVRQAEFETSLLSNLVLSLAGVTDDFLRGQRRAIAENTVRDDMAQRRAALHEIIELKEQWALRGALLARGVIPLSGGTVGVPSRDEVFANVRADLGKLKAAKLQPEPAPKAEEKPKVSEPELREIPADFGLSDSEYISGQQICAKAEEYHLGARATIQGDMRVAAGREKPRPGQRQTNDPDHGKPYIFERNKAIEILFNRLDRLDRKRSN